MKLFRRKRTARTVSLFLTALLTVTAASYAFADTYYLENGSVTVTAANSGQSVEQGGNSYVDDAPVITQQDASQPTSNTVTLESTGGATANATLDDVNIEAGAGKAGITVNGDAHITVAGDNHVTGGSNAAGIEVSTGDSLVLDGDGTLTATSGAASIKGTGAGIGGAAGKANGDITITDDINVVVTGSSSSASGSTGIGDGSAPTGNSGNIVISGNATVSATGGGTEANGKNGSYSTGGAGIGTSGGDITISGNANVTAQGGYNSAGIGATAEKTGDVTVTVSERATVNATGGDFGAGIGGGVRSSGVNVIVDTAGTVSAHGGLGGAGIGGGGGGYHGKNGSKETTGGAGGVFSLLRGMVNATGGAGAAGVGGGSGAVHAYSGNVNTPKTALGGEGAQITLLGGKLVAIGGEGAVGVGAGSNAIWSKNSNGTFTVNYTASDTSPDAGRFEWQQRPTTPTTSTTPTTPPTVIPFVPDAPANNVGTVNLVAPIDSDVATGAGVVTETIADNATPPAEATEILPDPTPLAEAKQWALINLICAVATALLSVWMVAGLLAKRERDAHSNGRHKLLRVSSIAVFAAGAIAFFLTEDMTNSMALIDGYTPLMAGILAIQALLAAITVKHTEAQA